MKKTACHLTVAVAAICTLGGTHGMFAQDFESVEIKPAEIASGVYMLEGRGGNIGVSAGDDGVFLIDDQYAPLTEKIVTAIRSFSEEPIRFVINTHWHGDHTGGNENLGDAGAVIVAHENVRQRLSTTQLLFGNEIQPLPHQALPVITFTRDLTFHLNGEELEVFHVENAHTDGDAVIFFTNSNVLHTGDVYFNGRYPFIDYQHGGSADGVIAAVNKMLERVDENTRIIPGHGPLSNKAELEVYRDMLVDLRGRMLAEIEAGKTVEDVLAADLTAEYDAVWGNGSRNPERFTRFLYADLSRPQQDR